MSIEIQYRIRWKSIPHRADIYFLKFDVLHLWSDSGKYIAQILIQSNLDHIRAIHTRDGCLSQDDLTKIKSNILRMIEDFPNTNRDNTFKTIGSVIQRTPRYFESGASILYPNSCIKQKMIFDSIINDLQRTIYDDFIAKLKL